MKNILYAIILTLLSCDTTHNFYQGKVLDEKDEPLEGVTVIEDGRKKKQNR